jgi:hypothetical protein
LGRRRRIDGRTAQHWLKSLVRLAMAGRLIDSLGVAGTRLGGLPAAEFVLPGDRLEGPLSDSASNLRSRPSRVVHSRRLAGDPKWVAQRYK